MLRCSNRSIQTNQLISLIDLLSSSKWSMERTMIGWKGSKGKLIYNFFQTFTFSPGEKRHTETLCCSVRFLNSRFGTIQSLNFQSLPDRLTGWKHDVGEKSGHKFWLQKDAKNLEKIGLSKFWGDKNVGKKIQNKNFALVRTVESFHLKHTINEQFSEV